MMHAASFRLPIILLALVAGVAIETGGVCVVRAAAEAAAGRLGQLLCNGLAACAAAAALVLARQTGMSDGVPSALPSLAAIAGGLIFAGGARLNGACAIGTVSRLAEGDLAYLATLAGAGLAAYAYAGPMLALAGNPPLTQAGQILWAAAMCAVTGAALLLLRHRVKLIGWPSFLLVGFTGALLAASQAHWAWIDVARDIARGNQLSPMALVAGGALFLGAVGAAMVLGRVRLRVPTLRRVVRDFAGGALMMTGGVMIPGGNDGLVLYGMPGGSPRAAVAWVVMFLALVGWFKIEKERTSFLKKRSKKLLPI